MTSVLPFGGVPLSGSVMRIFFGADSNGLSCSAAFETPALPPELEPEPLALALSPLSEPPQAATVRASATAAMIAAKPRLGWVISSLSLLFRGLGPVGPQWGPEPRWELEAAAAGPEPSSTGTSDLGPRPKRALMFDQWLDGDRWMDSATATIRATPLNMSLSQLAPDTS